MESVKTLFGRKIRELRKKKGLTQAQLAEMVSVDDKHISCIEGGKNFPSPDLIERFANSFDVKVKDLFEFNHLKESKFLKEDIAMSLESLNQEQLQLVYKFIATFII